MAAVTIQMDVDGLWRDMGEPRPGCDHRVKIGGVDDGRQTAICEPHFFEHLISLRSINFAGDGTPGERVPAAIRAASESDGLDSIAEHQMCSTN